MKKVYAVCDLDAYNKENASVWTISENPNEPGWDTDGGYSGYGLRKEVAEFYVRCINKCISDGLLR